MSNISWAPADCPHVYLRACMAAMPLKPPTLQPHQKCFFLTLGGFRGMVALHACKYTCGQSPGARPVRFTNFWILDSFEFSEQKLRFDSFRFFSTIKNHTTRFNSILYSDQKSRFNSGFIRYQVGWDPTQLQFTTAKVQLNSRFIGQNQQLWS